MAALDWLPERVHPAIYVAVGVLTFLIVLFWQAPAALLPHLMPRIGAVTLERPSGTLWDGRAELVPVGQLQWQVNPLPLLVLRADIDWLLQGPGILVAGKVSTRGGDLQLQQVKGQVGPGAINPMLRQYRMSMEGDLRLAGIEARASGTGVSHLDGRLAWEGGTVNYVLGGQSFTVPMPALGGELRAQDGMPTLDVSLPDSGAHVMRVTLNAEGWAEIKMTKRFLEVAGFPWKGSQSPETYVLVVSEQLF